MVHFNYSKEEALVNLWKATKTLGLGALHSHNEPTVEDAKEHFEKYGQNVDYFFGRPIKTNFNSFPNLNPTGYDRDAGTGTMNNVANNSFEIYSPTKKLNSEEIDVLFKNNQLELKSDYQNGGLKRVYTSREDEMKYT